jgi:hypothetical protein
MDMGEITPDDRDAFLCLWQGTKRQSCPYCGHRDFYLIGRTGVHCTRCSKEYWPLKKTWFSLVRLNPAQWQKVLQQFEHGVSAQNASRQLGIHYKTVFKAYSLIRRAIFEESARADPTLQQAARAGILERVDGSPLLCVEKKNGSIRIKVSSIQIDTLIRENVAIAKRGPVYFTERRSDCETLIFLEPKDRSIQKKIRSGKIPLNRDVGEFLSFMMDKMIRYPHISPKNFLYYVIEMEWRYNNRKTEIGPLLREYLGRDLNGNSPGNYLHC